MDPIREHLIALLDMKGAHIEFDAAMRDWPDEIRGVKPEGAAHSAWQLLEHMRIAQWDILEFSRNGNHVSPDWPEGYWPPEDAPPDRDAWQESIRKFRDDLSHMKTLVADPAKDLIARIPHGDGQTLLREALLVADHNSYHLGQLAFLRKMLES